MKSMQWFKVYEEEGTFLDSFQASTPYKALCLYFNECDIEYVRPIHQVILVRDEYADKVTDSYRVENQESVDMSGTMSATMIEIATLSEAQQWGQDERVEQDQNKTVELTDMADETLSDIRAMIDPPMSLDDSALVQAILGYAACCILQEAVDNQTDRIREALGMHTMNYNNIDWSDWSDHESND